MGGRLLFKPGFYSSQASIQTRLICNAGIPSTGYVHFTRIMCGAYMSEGKKKLPILTHTWSIYENFNLSGMVFTLESSGMSFLSAPGSYSWCCKHNAKKIGDLSKKGKNSNLLPSAVFLRFETLCRGANRHPLCRDTENSWWLVPWPK